MSIYLDHNATAPLCRSSRERIQRWLSEGLGNPSSVHAAGRRQRALVETARRNLATEIGSKASDVVFTSGATEAIDLAIKNLVAPGGEVVCSSLEHPAVYGALESVGAQVRRVSCDAQGRLNAADFVDQLTENTQLVVLMAAQNEIGNVFPVADVAAAVAPVPVFCDAVQLFGRVPIDVNELGVRALVVSSHKIGGPTGVGALWMRGAKGIILGGPQERGRRARADLSECCSAERAADIAVSHLVRIESELL